MLFYVLTILILGHPLGAIHERILTKLSANCVTKLSKYQTISFNT